MRNYLFRIDSTFFFILIVFGLFIGGRDSAPAAFNLLTNEKISKSTIQK